MTTRRITVMTIGTHTYACATEVALSALVPRFKPPPQQGGMDRRSREYILSEAARVAVFGGAMVGGKASATSEILDL